MTVAAPDPPTIDLDTLRRAHARRRGQARERRRLARQTAREVREQRRRRGDRDADHARAQARALEAHREARRRSARSHRDEHHVRLGGLAGADLVDDLLRRIDEAERAERARSTEPDEVRVALPPRREQRRCERPGRRHGRVETVGKRDAQVRAGVCRVRLRHEDGLDLEAVELAEHRGRHDLVAPHGADGEELRPPCVTRGAEQQLELAHLVSAVDRAGEVVPLDPEHAAARHRGGIGTERDPGRCRQQRILRNKAETTFLQRRRKD